MVELLNVNFINSRSHLLGVCFEAIKAVFCDQDLQLFAVTSSMYNSTSLG